MDRSRAVPLEVQVGDVTWGEWRSCRSKALRLTTRREARWWRRHVRRCYGYRTRVYRCRWCHGLHLTKTTTGGPVAMTLQEIEDGVS